jgi:hypothetical protein
VRGEAEKHVDTLQVGLNSRARLFTAVLAASDWPAREQARKPHKVHAQAKKVRDWVAPQRQHIAVQQVNAALADGHSPAALLQAALMEEWPDLDDFARAAALDDAFWSAQEPVWQEAVADLQTVFQSVALVPFLRALALPGTPAQFRLLPNLFFPALTPLPTAVNDEWALLLPPPQAWGTSPPWPYAEDPGWVVGVVCAAFVNRLLAAQAPAYTARDLLLQTHALTALCLERELDELEGQAYMLRMKKAADLPDLPQTIAEWRERL